MAGRYYNVYPLGMAPLKVYAASKIEAARRTVRLLRETGYTVDVKDITVILARQY